MAIPLELITGVGGFLLGATGTWINLSTMRERRQPIVLAHEDAGRDLDSKAGAWFVLAHVKNESGPTAFNVRFGVEYAGVRFPYVMSTEDPEEGNYQAAVQPGQRLPEQTDRSFPIPVASSDIWAAALTAPKGTLDKERVYWCRYENARGQTWETRNPGDRSAKLEIRRVHRVKQLEQHEAEQRARVRGELTDWANALAALQQRPEASDA
jgi:hypothetical protein